MLGTDILKTNTKAQLIAKSIFTMAKNHKQNQPIAKSPFMTDMYTKTAVMLQVQGQQSTSEIEQ